MKKIYLLLAAFVGAIGMAVWAADTDYDYEPDRDNPLITDVEQFSSPYDDPSEGNFYTLIGAEIPADEEIKGANNDFWHSDWHQGNQPVGSHYFQVEMPDEVPDQIVFEYTRRNVANDQTTEWSIRGTNDPDAEKDECEELAYILTPLGQTNETIISKPFTTGGYKYLRFYSENQAGDNGARGYFHMARFQLYPLKTVDEVDAAQQMLSDAFEKYSAYYDSFPVGTSAGEYGEEEVEAFQALVNTLDIDMMDPAEADALTKEKAQEMIDAVEAAYQAVLASKVTFALESGYYRIHAGMEYYNEVVVGHDDETDEDITEEQLREKYLMADRASDGKYKVIWGTPDDYAENTQQIRPLFKITNNGDGTYDFESMMYNTRFNDVTRSETLYMSKESTNTVCIDAVGTYDDFIYVNMHVSTQNGDDGLYLHQGGHNDGQGKGGDIVGWYTTWEDGPRASEWYFEPVEASDAEAIIAAWQPELEKENARTTYKADFAQAQAEIEAAKDVAQIKIITDEAQLSSPCSDSQEGVGSHDIKVLIDGITTVDDNSNFWHTDWHGEFTTEDHHYFQVEMPEDFDAEQEIYIQFTRRKTDNDHITKWGVYGMDEDDFELIMDDESFELLAEFDTPYTSNTETIKTDLFKTNGHKYLRFYCLENSTGRQFFHLSEFNLCRDQENPNSQYSMIGQPAVDLEAVIAEQKGLTDDEITDDVIAKFNAAYAAFKAEFVDPAELRQVIDSVAAKPAIVAVGTQPGFWPDASTADALTATINAAKAYDEAGHYAKAQSTKYINDLRAQAKAIDDAAIRVKTGKWYRFRFGTEEEYDEHEWPKTGCEEETNDAGDVLNEALFGKYVTVAQGSSSDGINTVSSMYADDVALGQYLYMDDDIEEKDLALFRFVSVGDTAFALQNKATGLFLQRPNTGAGNRYIRLSVSPSLFTQGIAGYGQNYFSIRNLEGTQLEAIHAARAYNIVQTWGGWGNTDGRRGCFYVEEAGDVAADYDGTAFKIDAKPGTINLYCFPMGVKGTKFMYGLNATTESAEGISLTLVPITEAKPGRPWIFVSDGEYDAEADDAVLTPFTHSYDITAQADSSNILHGVFYGKTVGDGVITLANNKLSVTRSPQASVNDATAYITKGEDKFDTSLSVTITIDAEGEDGIQAALQNVARTGNIYTIDGQLVGRGNINNLRQKGIYIINGTKVVVK